MGNVDESDIPSQHIDQLLMYLKNMADIPNTRQNIPNAKNLYGKRYPVTEELRDLNNIHYRFYF